MKISKTALVTITFLIAAFASAQEAAKKAPLMANELLEKMEPHLIDAAGEKQSVDLKKKDYVLVYWSASWCGPCLQFTPRLVNYYNENGGGDKFEIVLVCIDRTEEKMMRYMRVKKMPWPAVRFDEKAGTGAKSFAKGGIPRLMIINKKGEVIDRGNGPSMLRKFKKLVRAGGQT